MKEQLAALIESYAAARASGNGLLQQFATSQLSQFLQQVELIKPEASAEELPAEVVEAEVG
jgi:hypothetical protein